MPNRTIIRSIAPLFLLALLTGCANQPKQQIPRRGELVAQGSGELSFRAPDAGLVSVYDVNTDSLIHSSAVARGTVVTVNPAASTISVSDADRPTAQVVNNGVNKSHHHELWFIPVQGGTYTATAPTGAVAPAAVAPGTVTPGTLSH